MNTIKPRAATCGCAAYKTRAHLHCSWAEAVLVPVCGLGRSLTDARTKGSRNIAI